ncbi:MerR family transcriptional regulator [Leekyejoonella antrihumi]|uniref:MerR family transcriptional regulator n=1 Tax=Leekyejoonella antrihumi TaxID=1660198 RepID=A0A563E286_9MICO|nr:MerR family transcriptional regulator [Leekyejoonella antrihumi]TWP36658.1 MerR family transcriptional regulator [Leekyejoonella antrihumi]
MQQSRLKIGEVARRTGLTRRALRYYEQLGLLGPAERLTGGHRVYSRDDLLRLYRICLLRQLGTPLSQIRSALDHPVESLETAVTRQLGDLDERLAALARLREKVAQVDLTVRSGATVSDQDLLALLDGMSDLDRGVRRRLTLLVYEDLEAAHDFLVTVFGLGRGPLTYDEAGRCVHGVIVAGDGLVWLHPTSTEAHLASPRSLGAATHCMAVFVDDVDAHYERVMAAGALIECPPRDMDYGVREYDVRDNEGGLWSFMTELDDDGGDIDE